MLKYILSGIVLLLLTGCGNHSKNRVNFAPKEQETIVTRHPALDVSPAQFAGQVKLMVAIVDETDSPTAALLRNKLIQLCAANGMGAIDGSPTIVLTPQIVEVSHNLTATIPKKHQVACDMTLYVANLATAEIYGSVQQRLLGVGDSKELALRNAVANLSVKDPATVQMLQKAEEQIIAYYNTYGDEVLAEAQAYVAVRRVEPAMTLLNSIPKACADLYKKSLPIKADLLVKGLGIRADEALTKMKASLAATNPELGGYCPEAMSYYEMIPAGTAARKEADAIYEAYIKRLNPAAKQQWEKEQRNWQAEQETLKRKHELNLYQEEMAAKIAIDGQTALLNKYKKDVANSRMGAFWRFFYRENQN